MMARGTPRGRIETTDRPSSTAVINEERNQMNVISRRDVPVIGAIHSDWPALDGTPLTYGLLRRVLVDGGSIDEREAQKMDRAISRLLER
jgi:hypothetical protein